MKKTFEELLDDLLSEADDNISVENYKKAKTAVFAEYNRVKSLLDAIIEDTQKNITTYTKEDGLLPFAIDFYGIRYWREGVEPHEIIGTYPAPMNGISYPGKRDKE